MSTPTPTLSRRRALPYTEADRQQLHRYALFVGARFRDVVSRDDQLAQADLALCLAAERYDPTRGRPFVAYARTWVTGLVHQAIRRELTARERKADFDALPRSIVDHGLARRLEGRDLLRRLGPAARALAFGHAMEETTLREVAAQAGRHPSWATRRWRDVLATAAALVA